MNLKAIKVEKAKKNDAADELMGEQKEENQGPSWRKKYEK